MNPNEILKQVFGYDEFRPGQGQLVEQILQGRDVMGIMPTGAGKSICFQVPALALPGMTIVVSPLISLMTDQVQALVQQGVKSACLNSTLTSEAYRDVVRRAYRGEIKILYVAPERLLAASFIEFAKQADISMMTVDEAHCLSQWGQDFRPSYLKVLDFIQLLPNRPILSAFTATATSTVKNDVMEKLQLHNPYVLITGFDRTNLSFEVRKPKDKFAELGKILKEKEDTSGIVYCSTRKSVEEVYEFLKARNVSVGLYHAGLSDDVRSYNQEEFIFDRKKWIVATNAFGMGIDKSNVSVVVHFNMPKNLENYYQEAGRAGRDGEVAECILLYGGQDVATNQFMIENSNDNPELDFETQAALKAKDRELLKQMTYYCHTQDCLRGYILKYFGEHPSNYCGNCSNCLTNFEEIDITVDAQKIISCIKRLGERFGVKVIADTLRGKDNQRIRQLRLNEQSTFGIMADVSEHRIREEVNFLLTNEYLATTNSEYPVIELRGKCLPILKGEERLVMKVVKEVEKAKKVKQSSSDLATNVDQALFARLKQVRFQFASEQSVPAFVVFSDATLRDMCMKLPRTDLEMLAVSGVGHTKFAKYGEEFLAAIAAYADENANENANQVYEMK